MLYFLYYTIGQILYFHSAVLNQSVYMTSYRKPQAKDEINIPIALSAFRDRKPHAFLSLVDTELQVILIVY